MIAKRVRKVTKTVEEPVEEVVKDIEEVAVPMPLKIEPVKHTGKLVKGSLEAKQHMAYVRSKNKNSGIL